MKIALLGGKFDPPHISHQLMIFLLLEKIGADRVWVIPSTAHPFGYRPSPEQHRIAMIECMIRPWKSQNTVLIVREESIVQQKPHYTLTLLEKLKEQHPDDEFILAVGEDNWNQRERWYQFDKIEALSTVVVFGRGAESSFPLALPAVASREIRRRIETGKNVESMLPDGVAEYIKEHRLYQGG